jgi:hypothetical protein
MSCGELFDSLQILAMNHDVDFLCVEDGRRRSLTVS